MIRLGLRLTPTGGREAAIRLVVIEAAVMLGIGLSLIAQLRTTPPAQLAASR